MSRVFLLCISIQKCLFPDTEMDNITVHQLKLRLLSFTIVTLAVRRNRHIGVVADSWTLQRLNQNLVKWIDFSLNALNFYSSLAARIIVFESLWLHIPWWNACWELSLSCDFQFKTGAPDNREYNMIVVLSMPLPGRTSSSSFHFSFSELRRNWAAVLGKWW